MTYKILSLDGGGPWALIQACALADLFPGASGHQILGHFDLAIGNSGGSITLAGLVKDLTPAEIRDLFLNSKNRSQIFRRTSLLGYFINKHLGIGPKWSTEDKLIGLTALLDADPAPRISAMKMSALPAIVKASTNRDIEIIVTAFEYDLNREIFFSAGQSVFSNLGTFEPTLAGAVHASSNAPVNYFNAPAVITSVNSGDDVHRFWDGGVGGYNNPVLQGVVEGISRGQSPNTIIALSIGTATVWRPLGIPTAGESQELFCKRADPSTLSDITKMAESILDDPPDAASKNAHFATGAPNSPRIIRLNPVIGPSLSGASWALPPGFSKFVDGSNPPNLLHELDAFTALRDMPMDAVDQSDVELIHQLAQLWIAGQISNQPILRDLTTGASKIGYDTYNSARQAAMDLGF